MFDGETGSLFAGLDDGDGEPNDGMTPEERAKAEEEFDEGWNRARDEIAARKAQQDGVSLEGEAGASSEDGEASRESDEPPPGHDSAPGAGEGGGGPEDPPAGDDGEGDGEKIPADPPEDRSGQSEGGGSDPPGDDDGAEGSDAGKDEKKALDERLQALEADFRKRENDLKAEIGRLKSQVGAPAGSREPSDGEGAAGGEEPPAADAGPGVAEELDQIETYEPEVAKKLREHLAARDAEGRADPGGA